MKLNNLSNFKRSLEVTKNRLIEDIIEDINRIEALLSNISDFEKLNAKICPKCLSRDVRCMKNNRIFCRGCGYCSPKIKENK